jgi:hypothetical protein
MGIIKVAARERENYKNGTMWKFVTKMHIEWNNFVGGSWVLFFQRNKVWLCFIALVLVLAYYTLQIWRISSESLLCHFEQKLVQ